MHLYKNMLECILFISLKQTDLPVNTTLVCDCLCVVSELHCCHDVSVTCLL